MSLYYNEFIYLIPISTSPKLFGAAMFLQKEQNVTISTYQNTEKGRKS